MIDTPQKIGGLPYRLFSGMFSQNLDTDSARLDLA